MKISIIDIGIVISYVLFAIGLAAYYSKRASKNINEYFVSGRNLPWWVAGTSMVATTFAADTPLAITGIIAKDGISGNWLWWNGVLSGMLSTFLFARLWRRSGVITDVELAELRYDGKAASALRGFRAFYTAIPINCITMGWVLLAMQKIVVLVLGVPDTPRMEGDFGANLSHFRRSIQYVVRFLGCSNDRSSSVRDCYVWINHSCYRFAFKNWWYNPIKRTVSYSL